LAVLDFFKKRNAAGVPQGMADFLEGFSIEVMPRTAEKVEDFKALMPAGTRVYVAHVGDTTIDEMVATARRLAKDDFQVMPHFPARLIADKAMLTDWIARYQGEADVKQGLILAGNPARQAGDFDNSMQLLDTGLFGDFERLHVAGHPEGNRDIDPDGSDENVMEALRWKQAFAERSDAKMALATQFCFEPDPVIAWASRLKDAGIDLPVHIGIAGPAKLQTLIKFAIACGVGPSLKVLQKRALDVTKLVLPYEPDDMVAALAAHKSAHPDFGITPVHLFPLGGIATCAHWARDRMASGQSALTA
jgi:methylenetetrahydrofolate reductase (NADPH)